MKRYEQAGKEFVKNRHSNHTCIFPVEKLIIEHGGFCPSASVLVRANYRRAIGEWRKIAPAGDYFIQVLGAMRGGALYLDEVMAVYNKGVPGSWSKSVQNMLRKTEHDLKMCRAILEFDKSLDRKYHDHFLIRVHTTLTRLFKNVYSMDRDTISQVKESIRTHSNGYVRLYSYWVLFLSFGYYRLKIGRAKSKLRSIIS